MLFSLIVNLDSPHISWSPLHELVPETPLRHGHAISIDMAYSATLANQRGLLSDEDHQRILNLFSRAGLSMDHHQFDGPLLEKATAAILKTRDGMLRAAVPISPMGKCVFLNDVSHEEMCQALEVHKKLMKSYPRHGEGLEAFVDASDTGYTVLGQPVENGQAAGLSKNSIQNSIKHASGPEGVDGLQSGGEDMANNYTLSTSNGKASSYTNGANGVASGIKQTINVLSERVANLVTVDGNGKA